MFLFNNTMNVGFKRTHPGSYKLSQEFKSGVMVTIACPYL